VKASAAAIKAAISAERKQLVYPADPKIASGLASRYTSEDLGSMVFTRSPRGLSGSNGVWSINFATKANPDGTVSLVTASPGLTGLDFVVANEGGNSLTPSGSILAAHRAELPAIKRPFTT